MSAEIEESKISIPIPPPTVEHSEVNIRLPGLYYGPSDINKSIIARNRTKYQPRSINITPSPSATVCNISGQIEFQFTTSNQQWLDLFNSHFLTKYTVGVVGATPGTFVHLTQNLISTATFYVNGVQVAATNNWSVASQLNKRLQFSRTYNKSINNCIYESDATTALSVGAPGAAYAGVGGGYPLQIAVAGIYTDKEYLDGFFIRDRDSCWIPPNSEVRIVLIADPLAFIKATRNIAAELNTAPIVINAIELVAYSVIKNEPIPEKYILKFTTNSITTSVTANTDCNRALTVDPNIVKVAIVFQDVGYATNANNKLSGGEVLSYAGQNEKKEAEYLITGAAGAAQLNTLQIQLGTIVSPPQAYDFVTNLHREAYEDYMMLTGKTLSYETQESFMDWLTEPIYLFDFPRPVSDKSTNLIVRGTRTAGGLSAQMHIIEMDEQLVYMNYDPRSGACISTTTLK